MNNIPVVKLGLIAVSRDCFPIQLSEKRRAAIKETYKGELYECPVTVENEKDMEKALEDVNKAECNALVVFLGNFGPETPETLIAERLDGPCMLSLIHISEPTRLRRISYAVFCLKKKKKEQGRLNARLRTRIKRVYRIYRRAGLVDTN